MENVKEHLKKNLLLFRYLAIFKKYYVLITYNKKLMEEVKSTPER